MSTLRVTTLATQAGVEVYTAKAWVNFNGQGTVAIRASGNVSSITDNGTGDYTINFTVAMVDANYAVNCHISNAGSASQLQGNGTGVLSGSYRITVANPGVSAVDPLYLFAAIFR